MEAKELMIGDWVFDENKTPHQIAELGTTFCTNMNIDLLFTERLSPIPLTEEILKANGWSAVPEYSDPFEEPQEILDYHWSPPFNSYPLCLLQLIDGSKMWKAFNGITIHYVHELQHALRLCGLNNLADNFKIRRVFKSGK